MRFSRLGSETILKSCHHLPRRSLHVALAIFVPSRENTRSLLLPAGAGTTHPTRSPPGPTSAVWSHDRECPLVRATAPHRRPWKPSHGTTRHGDEEVEPKRRFSYSPPLPVPSTRKDHHSC